MDMHILAKKYETHRLMEHFMSSLLKPILILAAILLVYALIFLPSPDIVGRRYTNPTYVLNRSLRLFVWQYRDVVLEVNGGVGISAKRFKQSYYYPFEPDSPISVTKDKVDVKNIGIKNDKVYAEFIVKGLDDSQPEIKTRELDVRQKIVSKAEGNLKWLKHLTVPVDEKKEKVEKLHQQYSEPFYSTRRAYIKHKGEEYAIKMPVEKGELPLCEMAEYLPKNKKELDTFLVWTAKIEGYNSKDEIVDLYDKPIKFELTPEGLKSISAGADKEFGTEDDQAFVRRY